MDVPLTLFLGLSALAVLLVLSQARTKSGRKLGFGIFRILGYIALISFVACVSLFLPYFTISTLGFTGRNARVVAIGLGIILFYTGLEYVFDKIRRIERARKQLQFESHETKAL